MQRVRTKSIRRSRSEDQYPRKQEKRRCRRSKPLKELKFKGRQFQKRRSIRLTSKSRSALISSLSAAGGSIFPVTQTPIGLRPSANFSPRFATNVVAGPVGRPPASRSDAATKGSYNGIENSVLGTDSLIFSSSRLIAKGFATRPLTPGSFSNS